MQNRNDISYLNTLQKNKNSEMNNVSNEKAVSPEDIECAEKFKTEANEYFKSKFVLESYLGRHMTWLIK